ncbi:uncharacterized protein N7469_005126 [Penicillium citrinum]|uniref:Uncharacterized protein n=1 Tax=Penicillium citrinum TaxID=5077 RepID=A0A9W9P137_PENCI|nr:uncharacterized protein N7469_005126 [Penicillium citrinum]KAJ5233360.1 hypothetical protein N7469_005126 [Penicillium citrinum]
MPSKVTWKPETDAKLFHGILAQIQDANLKLDYDALAKYMGPGLNTSLSFHTVIINNISFYLEYSAWQIKGRIGRIRGLAKADVGGSPSGSARGTPAASPEKRKRTPVPRAPRSKKPKKEPKGVNEVKGKKKGKAEKDQLEEEVTDVEQNSTDLKDLADVLEECGDKDKVEDSAMNESEEEKEVMDEFDEDA